MGILLTRRYNDCMTVHLHVRSSYSLLDSTIRIPALLRKAKECGSKAVALTDHNVMHGTAAFLHACRSAGIKPLIGLEADCLYHDETVPFLLLARDNIGYQNLVRLSSLLCTGHSPCTTEQLRKAAEHCVLIAYGEGGWCDSCLIRDDRPAIRERLQQLQKDFGRFDLALSYQESSLWKNRNAVLKQIARTLGITCCALNKIFYLEEKDAAVYKALTALRLQKTVRDPSLPLLKGRHFRTAAEMESLYDPEDLARTDEIAAECTADGMPFVTSLPAFPLPDGLSREQYLTQLCLMGLRKRLRDSVPQAYADRLRYELSVIVRMHFEDYFLIVYDYVRYARRKGILVGPGRGSAAGSLAAYCLGITDVDPLKYHLLFERFLNPDRISMPDIDTDFPDDRRDEVIEYVRGKYGADHVAGIAAYQTMGARAAVRDAARVLGMYSADADVFLKALGGSRDLTLRQILDRNAGLRRLIASERKYTELFRLAESFEGLPRSLSQHAAGVVMAECPLTDLVPVIMQNGDVLTTQFEAKYLEERGLIKMDFLVLRNLTVIDGIAQEIRRTEPAFDIRRIPLDDPAVYQVFARGDTTGIFQFEAEDMKRILRRLHPEKFEDIVAANALRRPGASDQIPQYIENRRNPSSIRWLDPALKPVLEDTYGIMIYQEQIMLTARIAAGFTPGKADLLRKAISKKDENQMASMKRDFVDGCRSRGRTAEKAEELWQIIEKFGSYGFNKAHSVAYSMISCQLAWLKAHYPLFFYRALLNSVIGDQKKTALYIDECRRRGIGVAGPDVNRSLPLYSMEGNALRMPLSCIREVGTRAAEQVIAERNGRGPYRDFIDFVSRANLVSLSRRTMEFLIRAGALDAFGENRRTMTEALDEVLGYAELIKVTHDGQVSLNADLVSRPSIIRYQEKPYEKAMQEKEALGFTLSGDALEAARREFGITDPGLSAIADSSGQSVTSFGMISGVREVVSRNNRAYCRLTITDGLTDLTVGVWPSDYQKLKDSIAVGMYVRFNGKMNENGYVQAEKLELFRRKSD